jgi:hypothetical protein
VVFASSVFFFLQPRESERTRMPVNNVMRCMRGESNAVPLSEHRPKLGLTVPDSDKPRV